MNKNAQKRRLKCHTELSQSTSSQTPLPFSTMSDAFARLSEFCIDSGYEHFLIVQAASVESSFSAHEIRLSNLPSYIAEDLIALDLLSNWSVTDFFEATSAPFQWDNRRGATKCDWMEDIAPPLRTGQLSQADVFFSKNLGVSSGLCIPAATRGNQRSLLVLFSTEQKKTKLGQTLFLEFQILHDQLESLALMNGKAGHDLNKREIECIRWAAAGKTSGEIATIVSLSEHTVNHYLNACCKKLDCVNRTQAVANAIRLQII